MSILGTDVTLLLVQFEPGRRPCEQVTAEPEFTSRSLATARNLSAPIALKRRFLTVDPRKIFWASPAKARRQMSGSELAACRGPWRNIARRW